MKGKTVSQYTILKKIAAGGMGEVWLAQDRRLERQVALKFLSPHLLGDETIQRRFLREARAAARLNHPNIVTIYEIGEHDGQTFIAMEYVGGVSIREMLKQQESHRVPLNRIFEISMQVCRGLACAHEAGIIHRDLKPENIVICSDGRVKILDFGLAQIRGYSQITKSESTLGTLGYMAPEMFSGGEVDHRADLWAVGVILYELLAGRAPFEREYEQAVIYSIVNEDPEPVAQYRDHLPPSVQYIVEKALEKDAGSRYQQAAGLLADLQREARKSEPGSAASATAKQERFSPMWKAAIGIFVAVILIVTGISSVHRSPLRKPPLQRQLTFFGDVSQTEISPDGQYLAFTRGKSPNMSLVVKDLVSERDVEVVKDEKFVWVPHWVGKGAQLSYFGHFNQFQGKTFLLPRLGGNRRPTSVLSVSAWAPDGDYSVSAQANWRGVYIIDAETDRIVAYIPLRRGMNFLADLQWSPRGDRLLVLTVDDSTYAISTFRIDGSQFHEIAADIEKITSPRWSADGGAIYYFRPTGSSRELVRVKISTRTGAAVSEPVVIQRGLQAGETFSVSRDNKQLFYSRQVRFSNLWRIDLNAGAKNNLAPVKLTKGTRQIQDPTISPDGTEIAFSILDRSRSNIHVMDLNGESQRQLTFLDSYAYSPAWSPSGDRVAFVCRNDQGATVYVVPAAGGAPRQFEAAHVDATNEGEVVWAPGAALMFSKPGSRNFLLFDPAQNAVSELLENDSKGWVFWPEFSPDGEEAAFTWVRQFDTETSGLWAVSKSDGSPRLLFNQYGTGPLSWSADGRWIYALRVFETVSMILRIPAKGGAADTLVTLPADELAGADITPDGKTVIYAGVETTSDAWVIEHFDPENELDQPLEAPDVSEIMQFAFVKSASRYNKEKKYKLAEKAYREGLALNPKNRILLIGFGWNLIRQKRYAESGDHFRGLVKKYTREHRFHNGLGWSLFYLHRYGEALEAFNRGLQISGRNSALLNGAFRASFRKKHFDGAKAYLSRYLEVVNIPRSRAYAHTSLAEIGMVTGDLPFARRHLERALAIDSTFSQALRGMAYYLAHQRRFGKAARYAGRALQQDSSFANRNLTAYVLVAGDIDHRKGMELARQCRDQQPETWGRSVEAYPYLAIPDETLGLGYLKAGNPQRAVGYLEKALALAPQRAGLQKLLKEAEGLAARN